MSRQVDLKERECANKKAESGRWPSGVAGGMQQVQAWASCMGITRTEWSEAGRNRNDEECCVAVAGWWTEVRFYLPAMACRFHLVRKDEQGEDESVALLGLKILKL